jgi:hypothetical protein
LVSTAIVIWPRFPRDIDTQSRGELFNGLNEAESVVIHQKPEHGAVCPAAEAVIELFVRTDPKGGSFLVVEGAAGAELFARFFQRDASANELDDVGSADDVVDKRLRN